MKLTWASPPAVQSRQSRWVAVASELRRRPGRWAIVATQSDVALSNVVITNLRAGRIKSMRGVEVTARRVGAAYDVYARFPCGGVT